MPTRIQQLASNTTMYYRGDICMEIAPFTNYYLFTIYRESEDSEVDNHVPLNLTNLGTVYLSFMGGDNKIRIPNYKDAENVDAANGEVAFRISESEAERILNLSNKTFYISTVIEDGTSSSDETVLFSGRWGDYANVMETSLTDTITALNETVNGLQSQITKTVAEYDEKVTDMQNKLDALEAEKAALEAQLAELESKVSSQDIIEATIVDDRTIPTQTSGNLTDLNLEILADQMQVSRLNSVFSKTAKYDKDVRNYPF